MQRLTKRLPACWLPMLGIAAVGLLAMTSQAATHYVDASRPNDNGAGTSWATAKKTIQAAVTMAAAGSEIIVTNGVYTSISTANKAITIRSVNGADKTFIDGGGTNSCARLGSYDPAHTNTVLIGFTLRNGKGNSTDYAGGVSYGTLHNCVLTGNNNLYSYGGGGGAYRSTLNNCTLSGNTAKSGGGGAYRSTLNNCILTENTASGNGGGVYNCTLNNCTLSGNTANSGGGGAYSCTLNNCTLSGNTASSGGGAQFGTLNNCVLSDNMASYRGGGVSGGTLINCTLTGNAAGYEGGVSGSNYSSALTNCIVWGNIRTDSGTTHNYSSGVSFHYSCTTPLPSGTGNISQDPLLIDGVHIASNSPCVDMGSYAYCSGTDIDGEAWLNPPCMGCDQVTRLNLSVVSVFGGATTMVMTNGCKPVIDAWVTNSPIVNGSTQYMCIGATVVGNAFTQNSATNISLTLTNNAVLTWQWQTNYWLEVTAQGHGTVSWTNGWMEAGTNVILTANPEADYHLAGWSGNTNGCSIQGNQITVHMTDPRTLTAFFIGDNRSLTVFSDKGAACPGVGVHKIPYGTTVTCWVVNSPVVMGSTQYVCTGWSGLGDVPGSGGTTNIATFLLVHDSAVSWAWQTEYKLDTEVYGVGEVNVTDSWVKSGNILAITANPKAEGVIFTGWDGDTDGCFVVGNQLIVTMDRPRQVVANFVSLLAARGTPTAWMAMYGLTNQNYDVEELADVDGDGFAAWQEYVTGSNPTNRESVFLAVITLSNDLPLITWTPNLGSARVYWVEGKTNLTDSVWGSTNANSQYFRVKVGMP